MITLNYNEIEKAKQTLNFDLFTNFVSKLMLMSKTFLSLPTAWYGLGAKLKTRSRDPRDNPTDRRRLPLYIVDRLSMLSRWMSK